jgi:hypothetical protein
MKDEPQCIEVTATVSLSGKVQIVRYEHDQSYFYSLGGKWTIPDNWTAEEIENYRLEKLAELRTQIEDPVQTEINDMIEQRDSVG